MHIRSRIYDEKLSHLLSLGKFWLGSLLNLSLIVLGHLIKTSESLKKKKKASILSLKPKHDPKGWRKPLKPDALNLDWLGVIDPLLAT